MGDNFNVEGHEKRWFFSNEKEAAIGRFSAIDAGLCLRCWRGLEVGGGFVLVVQCHRSARERKTGIRQQDNNNKHAQLVCLAVCGLWHGECEWAGDRVLFCSKGSRKGGRFVLRIIGSCRLCRLSGVVDDL